MLIKIASILLQVSFVVLQTASTEDEPHPSSASSSSPFSPSSEPSPSEPTSPSSPSPPESLPTVTSNTVKTDEEAMWAFELLNYSSVCSLYDNNVHYLSTVTDNIKLVYHYLLAQFLSLLTLWPSSQSSPESDNHVHMSRLSGSALSYHLYTLQTLLFRTETVAVICILLILAVFLHSLIHYRERHRLAEAAPFYSPLSAASPKSYQFLAKLLRCLNFTILFSNLFGFVDSALKNFRSTEAITVQLSHGHAGVYSLQGRRPNMEDCFSLKNNVSKELGIDYYAVYDGHGGPHAALLAEKEIFDGISKRIKEILTESNKENCENLPNQVPSSSSKDSPSENKVSSSCSSPSSTSLISSLTNIKSCPASSIKSLNRFDSLTVNAMKNILHEEVMKVDKRLVEQFRKKSDISGSTALIAVRLIHSNTLLVANVGDSRAILGDWKGATIPLSFDHKPYQLKEYRRIVEAGGYIMLKGVYRVNGILAVSRALGDYPLKEDRLVIPDPDILSFDLKELKPKFMVVASDGFWDTFSNDDAARFVRNELVRYTPNYAESQANLALYIAKKLVNEAYTRESYDNITVIVVLFEDTQTGTTTTNTTTTGGNVKIGQASSPSKSKPLTPVSS